jgi:hypothetical protein
MGSTTTTIARKEIEFPSNQRAQIVHVAHHQPAPEVLAALGLEPPRAVFLISGGAASLDGSAKARLLGLFSRGIAQVAADCGALLIDGGTQAGVMELIGKGAAGRAQGLALIGVAPVGKVVYPGGPTPEDGQTGAQLEPHHTHFVLVEGDRWGDETDTMFQLAAALSTAPAQPGSAPLSAGQNDQAPAQPAPIPVVTFLAGGGAQGIARKEVLHSVRHGWPVILIEGSGGLADEIAGCLAHPTDFIADPELAEIVEVGKFHLYPIDESVEGFRRLIARQLEPDQLLAQAWRLYRRYSQRARSYQRIYYRLQLSILSLGVLTTALVLLQATLKRPDLLAGLSWLPPALAHALAGAAPWAVPALQVAIIALPIVISILLAWSGRLNPGNKWILLRNSAEAVKRAIFIYRTRPPSYQKTPRAGSQNGRPGALSKGQQRDQDERAADLANQIEFISRQLMQTDVNHAALPSGDQDGASQGNSHSRDDGFSLLSPQRYIAIRLDDQLAFYTHRTAAYERELNRYQTAILVAGGAGTFLAAVGLELWVALTTAITAATGAYLQHKQTEHLLVRYNQAAADMQNIKNWWIALSPYEQARPENVRQLVEYTEKALDDEHAGWVQEMHDALSSLRKARPELDAEALPGLAKPKE